MWEQSLRNLTSVLEAPNLPSPWENLRYRDCVPMQEAVKLTSPSTQTMQSFSLSKDPNGWTTSITWSRSRAFGLFVRLVSCLVSFPISWLKLRISVDTLVHPLPQVYYYSDKRRRELTGTRYLRATMTAASALAPLLVRAGIARSVSIGTSEPLWSRTKILSSWVNK